jgi:hypothetical protein
MQEFMLCVCKFDSVTTNSLVYIGLDWHQQFLKEKCIKVKEETWQFVADTFVE